MTQHSILTDASSLHPVPQMEKNPVTSNPEPENPTAEEEYEAAFENPAIYCNRMFLRTSPSGIRLSFGEQSSPDKKAWFRTSVFLTILDAIALRDLLQSQLDHVKKVQIDKDQIT